MPRVTPTNTTPDYQLTVKLLTEYRQLWGQQLNASKVDTVLFFRLSVVALTQLAATVGVDVGMTPEQFLAVCGAQFAAAYDKAPKFG